MDIASSRAGDRAKAAFAVIMIHGLIGYALIMGLGVRIPQKVSEAISTFDVSPVHPPPVEKTVPQPAKARRPEGAASPPNLKAKATQVVAPPPAVPLPIPPPIVIAPLPGVGDEASAGAANMPGPGSGAGGLGHGAGSGGAGDGDGDGDDGYTPPRRIRGRIRDSDFPAGAADSGLQGTVSVRYAVETNGRATRCTVTRSSGHAELDAATCRIIEERFRYDPSRDPDGVPVRSTVVENHSWIMEDQPRPSARAATVSSQAGQ